MSNLTKKPIRILLHTPNSGDATSYYRGELPLTCLIKTFAPDVELVNASQLNPAIWPDVIQADVIVLQRPFIQAHLDLAIQVKTIGRKLIIDYDDLLFNLPLTNPYYNLYMTSQVHSTINQIMNLADEIWVSTPQLRTSLIQRLLFFLGGLDSFKALPDSEKDRSFNKVHDKIVVIENAHNDFDFPVDKRKPHTTNNVILWRGGASHNNDLYYYAKPLLEICNTRTDLSFYFFGPLPTFLSENFTNAKSIFHMNQPMAIYSFHKAIQNLNPMVNLILLEPSEFNDCKSNINSLEGAYAGAYNFNVSPDEFVEKFNYRVSQPKRLKEWADEQWDGFIKTQLLSQTVRTRYERIQLLLENK